MGEWKPIADNAGHPIVEAIGAMHTMEADNVEDYKTGYTAVLRPEVERRQLWIDEVFSELEPGSSLLIFGSGHPMEVNAFQEALDLSRIVAMDIVEAAGKGLNPEIEFWNRSILSDDLSEDFDYIFSSHTIEHFTRDEVMNVILPKCLKHARKAVVFLVPYRDLGWGLPTVGPGSHLINLSEEDELAAKALKWKRIRDNLTADPPQQGIELVLWFVGKAYEE